MLNVGTRDLQPVHVHETRIHLVEVRQPEVNFIKHFLGLRSEKPNRFINWKQFFLLI